MKMRLLYILYCPPTPATWRQGSFNPFAILHGPIYRSPSPPPWPIAGGGGIMRSRFWQARGEGGDRYNTTTCRIASHAEWPRIESSMLFCNFFYFVKIIEKSLFSEGEIGFTRKKTSKLGINIFWIFWHLKHFRAISLWKKQGPFRPWSFWWGLMNRFYALKVEFSQSWASKHFS